jgi:starch phosphorylase
VLRALGIDPEVCHLNEGHAGLAVLDRARDFKERTGCSFEVALAATRAGNVFTTHTPVGAGFDRFSPDLIRERFRDYAEAELGISVADLLALGQSGAADSNEPFNMAWLAVHGSNAVNGVSRLHAEVSRRIFQPLFPRWPEAQVPVGHVTNGVHTPTCDSEASDALWTAACGKDRWREDLSAIENDLRRVPAENLWHMRNSNRRNLVEFVRERLARQIAGHGGETGDVEVAARVLDPEILTIGFARRFTEYKRPDLLLHDADRLLRILTDPKRPAQLVLAGKAHPEDYEGQQLVRRWVEFIRGTAARAQAVFLSDYDMRLAQTMTQGVDLWINTPRRPWEASGTSGMKVLVNGGVNLSELDGWWAEAWSDDVGWALGDGHEHGSDPKWDALEAYALYDLIEKEIVPSFYDRDATGIPVRWVDRMRESMARLTPAFSANRAVREYTEQFYIPAANACRQRSAERGQAAADLVRWRHQVEEHWSRLRFGSLQIDTNPSRHVFTAQVFLDELNPDFVCIQLFADARSEYPQFCEAMSRGQALIGSGNDFNYSLEVEANRPASGYTPRIIPAHPLANMPLDCSRILWRN